MDNASMYGAKIYLILRKLPEKIIPAIIAQILRQYKKYGLAELVEKGWDWTPEDNHIGVYVDGIYCRKNAKKKSLLVDENILKDSLIRSLCREADKIFKSNNVSLIEQKNQRISRLEKELVQANQRYYELLGRKIGG